MKVNTLKTHENAATKIVKYTVAITSTQEKGGWERKNVIHIWEINNKWHQMENWWTYNDKTMLILFPYVQDREKV